MNAMMAELGMEEVEEYFVLEKIGDGRTRLFRHFGDAEAARRHAFKSGGKLYRGHTALIRETLQEIPLDADDAY